MRPPLGQGLAALAPKLTAEQGWRAVRPVLEAMEVTTDPSALQGLGQGLAALTAKLRPEQAVQTLIDAMKIPWIAGSSSEILLTALQVRLVSNVESQVSLWDTIGQIEQQFGTGINLTSPFTPLRPGPFFPEPVLIN
jgi:hypothetical protein